MRRLRDITSIGLTYSHKYLNLLVMFSVSLVKFLKGRVEQREKLWKYFVGTIVMSSQTIFFSILVQHIMWWVCLLQCVCVKEIWAYWQAQTEDFSRQCFPPNLHRIEYTLELRGVWKGLAMHGFGIAHLSWIYAEYAEIGEWPALFRTPKMKNSEIFNYLWQIYILRMVKYAI